MKMKKDINLEGRIEASRITGRVTVHGVPRKAFEELKKVGIEGHKTGTEWVVFGGVSFFLTTDKEAKT